MSFQAIFLDAAPKSVESGTPKSLAGDFLIHNVKDFQQPNSILVSNRPSSELRDIESSHGITIVKPQGPTRGALATAMLTVDYMSENSPIVLIPTNSHLEKDIFFAFLEQMIRADYSAGTMCVRSDNPQFSYIRVHDGKVIEVIEKKVVGDLATTGIYFFRTREVLTESAKWAFVHNQTTNSSFYIAPCLNYAISKGLEIGYHVAEEKNYVHAN
jgi:dTDP-glucose pyrophosphorylase